MIKHTNNRNDFEWVDMMSKNVYIHMLTRCQQYAGKDAEMESSVYGNA